MDSAEPRTPGGLRIDPAALVWRFSRATGPGGQHVNKTESRVELLCDLSLAGLPEGPAARITELLGTEVRVVSSEHRSQLRNRQAALDKLGDMLDAAAKPVRRRHATRPSKGSVERRLEAKRATSSRKDNRRRPNDD